MGVIALDIDGVVADLMSKTVAHFGEPQVKGVYSLEEMYPSVSDENLWVFLVAEWTYADLPPYPEAIEAIGKLESDGWDIVFVTSRPGNLVEITVEWLDSHGIGYPVYYAIEKAVVCRELDCKAAVEDNLVQAKRIARVCQPTFLLDREYNSGPCAPAIRVHSWKEILEMLCQHGVGLPKQSDLIS